MHDLSVYSFRYGNEDNYSTSIHETRTKIILHEEITCSNYIPIQYDFTCVNSHIINMKDLNEPMYSTVLW